MHGHVPRADSTGVAASQVERGKIGRIQVHVLRNGTSLQQEPERNMKLREIYWAHNSRAQNSNASGIDQRAGHIVNREPPDEFGADVTVMRPLIRVRGIVAGIERRVTAPCNREITSIDFRPPGEIKQG